MSFISELLTNLQKRLILALCMGLLLTITAPYIGFGVYAWIGLVPLFLLVRSSMNYKTASLEALIFLLAYNLSFFIWIFGVHPLTWMHISNNQSLVITFLIWSLTALLHSVILIPVILLSKFFFQKNNSVQLPIYFIALIALAWVLITHTVILNLEPNLASIAVPLNELVYSQHAYKELIQVCNIIGAIGLEFIIVFVNLLILNSINEDLKTNKDLAAKYLGIVTVILIFIFSYGVFEIKKTQEERIVNKDRLKSFALIQANYSLASKEILVEDPMKAIQHQYQLSQQINNKVDFLFWAEGSVRMINKAQLQSTIFRALANKANVFVYGAPLLILDRAYNAVDFMEYRFTNQVATGFDLKHYYKVRLAPFGEYTPFYDFLPQGLKQVSDKTIGKNYIPSSPNQPILVNGVKIASSLCSELLFPQILRDQVRGGAELMLNLNDLSWFRSPLSIFQSTIQSSKDELGEDMLKELFLAIATFRAVENKRDLILSANTGHSALINPSGEIIVISRTNGSQVLQNSFLPSTEKALYTSYSW